MLTSPAFRSTPGRTWPRPTTATTLRIYRQRRPDRDRRRGERPRGSAGELRLGGNGIWGEFFAGKLDDVRIYDQALTAAQIQTDMNSPVGTPAPVDTTPPSALQGAGATGALGRVTLAWTASTDNVGVTRYAVYRSTTSGFAPAAANRIAYVASGTGYTDSGLAPGTYFYRVIAEDAAGNAGTASAEVSAASLADTTPPSTVTGVAVAPGLDRVTLNWSAATDDVGVARYVVHRSTTPGFTPTAATQIATVASGTTYARHWPRRRRRTSTACSPRTGRQRQRRRPRPSSGPAPVTPRRRRSR